MAALLLEIMLIILMSRSMQLSHDRVMIRIPIPITQGREIKLNPQATLPTFFHILASAATLLGHTTSSVRF
jgi:hypothetical protein